MILVSACLAGINCKYNGKNNYMERYAKMLESKEALPVCPEQLGGCPTPRPPAEIQDGDGAGVLDGKCSVIRKTGEDATREFIKGAEETLRLAKAVGADTAILKARSPSCGCGTIYDGTFSGQLKSGNGVTAELLIRNGIKVMTEEEWDNQKA